MWWPPKNPTYSIPSPTLNHKQPQDNGPISPTNKTMPCVLRGFSLPLTYKEAQEKELLRKRKRKREKRRKKREEAKQAIMRTDNSKLLKIGNAGGWTRECDSCRRSACAVVYCQADLAYLCAGCDTSIHAANLAASRHERVWVCESCERAPAAFSCKADAAALCITCDANIHSANALARKHHRVPILPISGFFLHRLSPTDLNQSVGSQVDADDGFLAEKAKEEEEVEDETNSWLLLNPVKNNNHGNGFLFGNEVEEYLDLDEYNSCTENPYSDQYTQQSNCDSVVPIQIGIAKEQDQEQEQELEQQQNFQMDYEASKSGFNCTASMNQSVSFSSMDASVVPDTSTVNTDISSSSHIRPPKGTIDLFSSSPFQVPPTPQFSPMDREARVLRYREKKKTRKFEKTIRYASRKAYAETRPRIKGRFAKRTDAEFEVDQLFSSSVMAENGYGIVPSF